MKVLVRSLLAVLLAVAGLGAPPVPSWAALDAPKPWTVPGVTADGLPNTADTTEREYSYQELSVGDLKIPDWMLTDDYLSPLPQKDVYKTKAGSANKKFQGAYDNYVDEMEERGQTPASREDFWTSFYPGGWNHFLTRWRTYKGKYADATLDEYKKVYIRAININPRGAAYEEKYRNDNGVDAGHGFTIINGKIPGQNLTYPTGDKKGKNRQYRVDGYRPAEGGNRAVILELKSGTTLDHDQLANILIPLAIALDADIVYGFGADPKPEELAFLEQKNRELSAKLGRPGRAIQVGLHRATGKPVKFDTSSALVAGGQQSFQSPAAKKVDDSPDSEKIAAREQEELRDIAEELSEPPEEPPATVKKCVLGESPCFSVPQNATQNAPAVVFDGDDMGDTPADLGGVDFASLELRYISDTYQNAPGVKYAYSVDPAPGQKVSYGGAKAAKLAADSFFVWLALPESSFTVNLNPEEPNRIVDERFGRTDAGRVLLEADFEMKKTVAKLIHPNSDRGRKFWRDLRGEQRCISMREWIVPKPAVVRENANELFILDAPLDVKMETEYENLSGSETCPGQATADTEHNERIYRALILPEVVKAVNTAPEYADLRRVYSSRVAAQWYRERSATKTTAYGHLVDSGDITPWQTKTGWKPRDTFDAYVNSYKKGEFRIKHTTRQGNTIYTATYVYGGVDFTATPTSNLPEAEFTATHPGIREAATQALPVADGSGQMWFGNETNELPPDKAAAPPPSPVSNPWFFPVVAAPVLLWLLAGGLLLRRRRKAGAA